MKGTTLSHVSCSSFVIRSFVIYFLLLSPLIACEIHLFMMIVRYTLPYTLIIVLCNVDAFLMQFRSKVYEKRSSVLYSNEQIEQDSSALDPDIARQFKVVICASDACNKKSLNTFGLEEYALFAGILERRDENHRQLPLRVEEGTCMGSCKFGPCIGVEHEDYEGYIGLDGMKMDELQDRVFKT
jgi:(2Fe-2S) ferredoxin